MLLIEAPGFGSFHITYIRRQQMAGSSLLFAWLVKYGRSPSLASLVRHCRGCLPVAVAARSGRLRQETKTSSTQGSYTVANCLDFAKYCSRIIMLCRLTVPAYRQHEASLQLIILVLAVLAYLALSSSLVRHLSILKDRFGCRL